MLRVVVKLNNSVKRGEISLPLYLSLSEVITIIQFTEFHFFSFLLEENSKTR